MKELLLAASMLLLCATLAYAQPIKDTAFIDHYNLRYNYNSDEAMLRSQTNEVKHNLDKAKEYGIGRYILFSRSFEYLVNYDFTLNGLGDLTNVVWPKDCEHRQNQALYAKYLNEVLDYADKLGIKIIFHTNQFDFPAKLYEMAGDRMAGSARVCPGKQMPYDALAGKVQEFFKKFPKCSGIQLTVSETQVKPTECKCDACKNMTEGQRFTKVISTVYEACKPLGKNVAIRTWGGFENPETVAMLPKEVICSTKSTNGDFHLTSGTSPIIGENADRQEVEFDGWGEYFGYNHFPCYMGDVYEERVKLCAERNVDRAAIRLNWNNTVNYMFDKPFGNEANIYVFAHLVANPDAKADDLLREYIAKVYPQSAREAAFKLYKRSFSLQKIWVTFGTHSANDHSRVYNKMGGNSTLGRVSGIMKQFGANAGYSDVLKGVNERRQKIDSAYEEAKQLINALGPDVPNDWKKDLEHGARTEWFTAQGVSDCMLLYAANQETKSGHKLPDMSTIKDSMQKRAKLWKSTDPDMFELMNGFSVGELLEEVVK